MKDKYINDIEPMIINWLKSGNENTTQIAYDIGEYLRSEIKIRSNLYSNKKTNKCPKCSSENTINYNTPSCKCLECNAYWAV